MIILKKSKLNSKLVFFFQSMCLAHMPKERVKEKAKLEIYIHVTKWFHDI
jgi:hypothetical protein